MCVLVYVSFFRLCWRQVLATPDVYKAAFLDTMAAVNAAAMRGTTTAHHQFRLCMLPNENKEANIRTKGIQGFIFRFLCKCCFCCRHFLVIISVILLPFVVFFSGLVTKFLAISDKNIPIYTYLRICTYIYGNWMWLCMCVCGLMYPCACVCVNNPAAFVVKSPDKNLFLLVFFLYVFFEMQFFGGFFFLLDKTNRLVWESQVTIHEEKYTGSLKNYNCNWI